MKRAGIVCLLWQRYWNVLESYLAGRRSPVAVLTLSEFATPEFTALVERHGGQVVALESFLDVNDRQVVHDKVNELLVECNGYFDSAAWEAQADRLGCEKAALGQLINSQAQAEVPNEVWILQTLQKAKQYYQIKLTVVIEDVTAKAKTMVLWSKREGIPSLHLLHGVALSRPYTVHRQLHADILAVYGERSLESYLDAGVDANRCRITGNPAWDGYPALTSRRQEMRRELVEKYNLNTDLPIVTFATTWAANLTAILDERLFGLSLSLFLSAVNEARSLGLTANIVIKDRQDWFNLGEKRVSEVAASLGLGEGDYVYSIQDAESWVVASDVLIGVDSNILVEAMMAATPAINLLTSGGGRLGPSFDAESGVVEAEGGDLAQAILKVLGNPGYRAGLQQTLKASASRYNIGVDGNAAKRVADLMQEMSGSVEDVAAEYAWKKCLEVTEKKEAIHELHGQTFDYYGGTRNDLVGMLTHQPRQVLDIGCAAGMTGASLKRQFPFASVWGIELNPVAAERAKQHLDRVLIGKFEDFDLEKEGILPGTLDTVIVADVLEHIYNPWDVLVRLKPLLSPDAQIVASIPNARNLSLMENLANGYWRYEEMGLLDITHIRFFTLKEIRRFFHETGYHVENFVYGMDPQLGDVFTRYQHSCPANIETEKLVLKNVSYGELLELCSLQIYVLAEPGAAAKDVVDYESTAQVMEPTDDVYSSLLEFHRLSKQQAELYEQRMTEWVKHPKFHLVILATERTVSRMQGSMQSLSAQLYYNVRVSVVASSPVPDGIPDSDRFEWLYFAGDLLAAANKVLTESDADWVCVMDAGDQLAPHTFLFMAEAAASHPDWQLIYSDEDRVGETGGFDTPCYKPDFNLDLLRSQPYIGGLVVVQKGLFAELTGFDSRFIGVEEYDIALRALERAGTGAIGHIAEVLYHRSKSGGHCMLPVRELFEAGRTSLVEHLQRTGVDAEVVDGIYPGSHRVSYRYADHPLVSILIAARDNLGKVQRCVESLLASTQYPNYEILIVDNGSQEAETKDWFAGLDALGEERLQIYRHPSASSQSQLHNLLAQEARGEYLLFLDFNSAILKDDWLDELMCHARRAEVGIVSPRLLGGGGMVRQTGQLLGVNGTHSSAFHQVGLDFSGYFGRAHLVQNFSALSSGCLLLRKETFFSLDGFDCDQYPLSGAVLDFCLRLRGAGRLLVYTPFANVLCEGGAEQVFLSTPVEEARKADSDAIYRQWLPQLARDPAYNLNLTTRDAPFAVGKIKLLTWDPLPWRPLPKILAYFADTSGCGQYRVIGPANQLDSYCKAQALCTCEILLPAEIERFNPDSIILQRQTMDFQINALEQHKRYSQALKVFEIDDLITHVPEKSVHRAHVPKDVGDILRRAVSLCDRFVVSTEPLAEAYKGMVDDIRVVPNFIRRDLWGELKPLRRQSKRPRVGWAGGISHTGDLELIFEVLKETSDEVDWIFFGMCPEHMRPYIREFHGGVPFHEYPAKMASLNLDLAVAPLELNPFNDSKTNLRLLEYGALGYPVICTDFTPYQGDFPVTRVKNDTKAWVNAIREHIADLDAAARMGDALREKVMQEWVLEDNLDVWLKAWLP